MATRDEAAAFLKLWYKSSVKDIEGFRAVHPSCKDKSDFVEGDKTTYPTGFTNQSLNQKAHRYATAADAQGIKCDHKDWKPAKKLKSKNTSKGGAAMKLSKRDFEGVDLQSDW